MEPVELAGRIVNLVGGLMNDKTLMTSGELHRRRGIHENSLALSIDKWERAGAKRNWPNLAGKRGANKHLMADSCSLCASHKVYGSEGGKLFNHCLGFSGKRPCPLVEKKEGNIKGCTAGSLWEQAFNAVKRRDRSAFMKARAKILRKLRAAENWY